MNYREYHPGQKELFGYRPEDVLEEGHLAYLIDEMVEMLDLREFYDRSSGPGNPAYDPRLMLKVIFMGYATGVFSSRKLQRQCQENMAFIYLTQGQQPRFRVICDFRVRHREAIMGLFPRMVKIARELGIVKMGRLILDGTKIKANASARRTVKAEKYGEILSSIKEYLERASQQDEEEDNAYGKDLRGDELPSYIRSKSKRVERLRAIIEEAEGRGDKRINAVDPEACFMKESLSGRIVPGYNLQACIDKGSGLIVGCDVSTSASDNKLLEGMVKGVEETTGEKIKELDADSGYYSNRSIAVLEEKGIDTCIPDSYTAGEINRHLAIGSSIRDRQKGFIYEEGSDSYRCPEGRKLVKICERGHRGKEVKVYRVKESCVSCKEAKGCLRSKGTRYRTLQVDVHGDVLIEIREKFKKKEYQERYRQRGSLIERIFGHFKKNLKFTQFHLRGVKGARLEAVLLAIGYNLLVMRAILG